MKYKTVEFEKHISYTSYVGLSGDEERAIEAANFDNIPADYEEIKILDHDGSLIAETTDEWQFKSSGWYVNNDGVKIKKEVSATPDFHKPNGHGTCDIKIILKIPIVHE